MFPEMVAACVGIFLLIGLWTPVVGTLIAVVELWIAFTRPGDPSMMIVLATLGWNCRYDRAWRVVH